VHPTWTNFEGRYPCSTERRLLPGGTNRPFPGSVDQDFSRFLSRCILSCGKTASPPALLCRATFGFLSLAECIVVSHPGKSSAYHPPKVGGCLPPLRPACNDEAYVQALYDLYLREATAVLFLRGSLLVFTAHMMPFDYSLGFSKPAGVLGCCGASPEAC